MTYPPVLLVVFLLLPRDNPHYAPEHSPPPSTPPRSVALLTALDYLQDMHDGETVDDLDELAANAGMLPAEMMPLIDRAEDHDFLSVDDNRSLRLMQKGWRRYETHDPE